MHDTMEIVLILLNIVRTVRVPNDFKALSTAVLNCVTMIFSLLFQTKLSPQCVRHRKSSENDQVINNVFT
jgi:hypothetical protein